MALTPGDPLLSVVIPCCVAATVTDQFLAALGRGAKGAALEVIVVKSPSDDADRQIEGRLPGVRVLRLPPGRTLPQLREAGIIAASGEIVALLDPCCFPAPGWAREVIEVHRERPEGVIGGSVAIDHGAAPTLVNWATYLAEYAAFSPPLVEGPTGDLPGGNISYKRWALTQGGGLTGEGFWKTFVNRRLQAQGHRPWLTPRMAVCLDKPIPFGAFFLSRYDHGRCFAAMRSAGLSRPARLVRILTIPLLPIVALWRRWRAFMPKRRHRAAFLMVLPILLLFDVSWAWGELWGYLHGPGGSCARLYY